MNLKTIVTEKIPALYKENKTVVLFLFRVLLIYFAWKALSFVLGEEKVPLDERMWPWLSGIWESFNDAVRIVLLNVTKSYFDMVGIYSEILNNYRLWVHGYAVLGVGNYCLAIQLWIFFAALIFSYEGKILNKIWFSILGIFLINLINVLRLIAVVYATHHYPEYIQFNHDYVFNGIIYVFTFFMWTVWVKHFSTTKKTTADEKE